MYSQYYNEYCFNKWNKKAKKATDSQFRTKGTKLDSINFRHPVLIKTISTDVYSIKSDTLSSSKRCTES